MLDISWGEFLLIGAVALIVIGPKELPTVLRAVGQWMTKLRRMANEFQGQFQEAIREAEMADLKKEVDEMTDKAKGYANFDPIGDVKKEIESISNPAPAADKPVDVAAAPTTPALEQQAELAAAAEVPLTGLPPETVPATVSSMANTPADVVAPVEAAMRAVAEVSAPQPVTVPPVAMPEVTMPQATDFVLPLAAERSVSPHDGSAFPFPQVSTPAPQVAEVSAPPPVPESPVASEPIRSEPVRSEPVVASTAPAEPAPPPASAPKPAPVLDEDGWPVPASFKEPLGSKRGSA